MSLTRHTGAYLVLAAAMTACEVSTVATVDSPPPPEADATAQAVIGDNAAGENLSGVNLGGVNLGGANLAGTNLGATNLAGVNLGGTNLAGVNLAGNNLAGNNLSGNNLAGTNLAGTNLGGNNLAGTNLAGTNLAATNLAGTNLAGVNLAGANLGAAPSTLTGSTDAGTYALKGTPLAGTYRLTAAAFTAGNAGVDIHNATPSAATSLGMLSSGEDKFTRANSCIALGMGSSAFARLVEENRAVGKAMYVALKRQSWGFAGYSGGPKRLDAWEAVVWGAKSYCVFLLVSPTAAPQSPALTFELMAGFIKAVFRWSAPIGTTLYIGELGTTRALVSYTGMMGAASKLLAGTISEKVFVAGLSAFISATTNNVSVSVDFASWVMTTAGTPLILGNVSGAPTGVESSFAAVEDPINGQILLAMTPEVKGTTALSDYASDLKVQYTAWKGGTRAQKPVPVRCSDFRYLNSDFGEPIPPGKCDRYVALNFAGETAACGFTSTQTWSRSFTQTWTQFLTSQAKVAVTPYNDLMYIPTSSTATYVHAATEYYEDGTVSVLGARAYNALSETYVALNQARYTDCTPLVETDAQVCARMAAQKGLSSWCGTMNATDTCNTPRTVSCGVCASPLSSVSAAWDTIQSGAKMLVFVNLTAGGAPVGGASVALSYSNTTLLSGPPSVLVGAGEPAAGVLVWTPSGVTTPGTASVTATSGGVSKTATVTVLPAPPTLYTLTGPTMMTRGVANTLTLTTLGDTTFARTISLTSNNANVPVPATVSVPVGASTLAFLVTPTVAALGTSVTISASMAGSAKTSLTAMVASPGANEVEANDTAATANVISTTWTPVSANTQFSEHDYFKVTVPAGKTLTVRRIGPVNSDSFGNLLDNMSLTDGTTTVSDPAVATITNASALSKVMTIHVWNEMSWDCDCYSASEPYILLPSW